MDATPVDIFFPRFLVLAFWRFGVLAFGRRRRRSIFSLYSGGESYGGGGGGRT
jgi:hypothetical protein